MRAWFSTAVLAWVTAVLVTSPVLAARSCLDCCAERSQADRVTQPRTCEHCPSGDRAVASPVDENCHGCPKCETARPVPVTPVAPVESWQPSDLFVDTLGLTVPATTSHLASVRMSDSLAGRASHPPLQILYCTWLN